MILNETVAAIADAIREKTGKSELIKPVDFAEEIKGVTAGGGDAPSGDSDWHYFDVSGLEGMQKHKVLQIAMTHKIQGESIENALGVASVVFPTGFGYMIPVGVEEIKAIGTDYSIEISTSEQSITIGQIITTAPWYGQVPEITKEQFYSLE